jgi:hypothetical protein
VFWDETYSEGSLTVALLGTFSNGQPPGQFADGFDIYLVLKTYDVEREPTLQLFDKLHFNKQVARGKSVSWW